MNENEFDFNGVTLVMQEAATGCYCEGCYLNDIYRCLATKLTPSCISDKSIGRKDMIFVEKQQ